MRALDPRLVRRARPVRVLLGVDVALGLAMALLVLLQAVLHGARRRPRVRRRRRSPTSRRRSLLLALAFAARGLLAWGFEAAGRRAAWTCSRSCGWPWSSGGCARSRPRSTASQGGEVAAAAVQGVDALEAYFARYLPQLVLAVVVPRRGARSQVAWLDLTSALIMLLTLPLVPVFMWLIGRYTEERAARALAGAAPALRPTSSTSCAGCRRCAP